MIVLFLNWLAEGKLGDKIKLVYSRKSILVLISIYLLHLLGLFFTKNFDYALHDLKIKLPLLILPIVIGTSKKIDIKKTKILFLFFVSAVVTSTIISFIVYLFQARLQVIDQRHVSVFISHIRFSLLVDISIFILLYMALFPHFEVKQKNKIIYLAFATWLSFFLLILESFTGILLFLIIFPVFIIYWAFHQKSILIKAGAIVLIGIGLFGILSYLSVSYKKYYTIEEIDLTNLDSYTPNGRLYFHNPNEKVIENGHYVWIYLCEEELEKEWNARSKFHYDSLDKKGQDVKSTLIRYITSKGLRKDSVGVSKLSETDVRSIENGDANYIFNKKLSLYPRLYQIIWEFDVYRKHGNPSGHSLIQRVEYLKNASQIIKRNFWAGVGTGDVEDEFKEQYENSGSQLDMKWRLRAHNQYVTFFLTFGIIGFLWILFAFFYPVYYERKNIDILGVLFLLIAFLSMLNEDTLETHTGISFFTFFYSLFILGYRKKDDITDK